MKSLPTGKENEINQDPLIDETDRCKSKKVMLGAVRFATHSCYPNCDYLAAEHKGKSCFKLKIFRACQPGEALTVNYWLHCFDFHNVLCKCGFPEKHGSLNTCNDHPVQFSGESDVTAEVFILLKDPPSVNTRFERRLNLRLSAAGPEEKNVELRKFFANFSFNSDSEESESYSPSTAEQSYTLSPPKVVLQPFKRPDDRP